MRSEQGNVDFEGWVVPLEAAAISPAFVPIVDDAVAAVTAVLSGSLHSLYLYGSVPRGTARVAVSDLDMLACLSAAPMPGDHAVLANVARDLSKRYAGVVREVGIGVTHVADVVTDPNGLGFFLKVLCICVHGQDLRRGLPRFRPTPAVALALNGDVDEVLSGYERRLEDALTEENHRRLVGAACRKIIRSAFGMVMARSRSWTPDREEAAQVFLHYFPEWSGEMQQTLQWASGAPASRDEALALLHGFGVWVRENFEAEARVT